MSARFRARRRAVGDVVARAARWAESRPDVRAVAVVGSYAYGRPRMGSDVDLVVLSDRLDEVLADAGVVAALAPGGRLVRSERWGPVHERRVRLRSGLLVELDLAAPDWAAVPVDPGTARVLRDGCRVVVDDGTLAAALTWLGRPVQPWRLVVGPDADQDR